jgi:hypothetical protein
MQLGEQGGKDGAERGGGGQTVRSLDDREMTTIVTSPSCKSSTFSHQL